MKSEKINKSLYTFVGNKLPKLQIPSLKNEREEISINFMEIQIQKYNGPFYILKCIIHLKLREDTDGRINY